MSPEISIIVPVFNVENYLNKCIDSIINQTFKNIELILVDDGSQDRSSSICDEYKEKDERIKVIHKQNGGLSSARNAGIIIAKGKYLCFIDSDDWVPNEAIDLMWEETKNYEIDIVVGKVAIVDEGKNNNGKESEGIIELDGLEAMEDMLYGRLTGSTVCGRLVKTEIAKKFLFPEGRYHEDEFVSFKYYAEAKRVVFIDRYTYYYVQRNGSIMHSGLDKASIDEIDSADYIITECSGYGEKYEEAAIIKGFTNYLQVFRDNKNLRNDNKEIYHRIINFKRCNGKKIACKKIACIKNS